MKIQRKQFIQLHTKYINLRSKKRLRVRHTILTRQAFRCVRVPSTSEKYNFFAYCFRTYCHHQGFHIWNSRCNGFNKSMEHLGEGGGRERTEGEIDRRIEGRTKGEPTSSLLLRLLSSLSPPLLPFSCSLWNQESFSEVTRRKRRASFFFAIDWVNQSISAD